MDEKHISTLIVLANHLYISGKFKGLLKIDYLIQ